MPPTKHKTRAMNEFFEHGQASENESANNGQITLFNLIN
jgi:hypothetical protein